MRALIGWARSVPRRPFLGNTVHAPTGIHNAPVGRGPSLPDALRVSDMQDKFAGKSCPHVQRAVVPMVIPRTYARSALGQQPCTWQRRPTPATMRGQNEGPR